VINNNSEESDNLNDPAKKGNKSNNDED